MDAMNKGGTWPPLNVATDCAVSEAHRGAQFKRVEGVVDATGAKQVLGKVAVFVRLRRDAQEGIAAFTAKRTRDAPEIPVTVAVTFVQVAPASSVLKIPPLVCVT